MHSWRVLILEFIDYQLYEKYDFNEPWDGPNNSKLIEQRPSIFAFHHSEQPRITNYLAVVGSETMWPEEQVFALEDVKDDSGQTILLIENHGNDIVWTEPRDLQLADMQSVAAESVNGISSHYNPPAVVMVNTKVITVPLETSADVIEKMMTRNGGETIEQHETLTPIKDGRDRPLKDPK